MRAGSIFVIPLLLAGTALGAKPRLIILTDIGGDPDDQQSMVRLMTYSNEFDIEGLIASASGTPGELDRQVVRPELIRETVRAYGLVRANLARHAPGFPPEEDLERRIKAGNPQRGVEHIGNGADTEGSKWIIATVDRPDTRPVNIAIWGGATELAQALWRVRNGRSPAEVDRFVAKLRVHSIGHQDNTGPWILENFPKLFFILSSIDPADVLGEDRKARDRRLSVYRGMYLGGDESLTSREWIETNVRTGHGPLGALYPPKTWTAPNPHSALKEGDTPSWFYFLRNGLNDPERPEWGGWGGRFRRVRDSYFNDAEDRVGGVLDGRATVWRWRPAFQNEFAARLDWCVPGVRANHRPVAVLNGDRTVEVVRLSVESGSRVELSAGGSSDPDGDRLSYRWWIYPEAGTFRAGLMIENQVSERLTFAAPAVSAPAELHMICEVVDSGSPALTAYRRAVILLQPAVRP